MKETWVCSMCGSDDVESLAWINPNNLQFVDDYAAYTGKDLDNYCNDCMDHYKLVTKKYYEEHHKDNENI